MAIIFNCYHFQSSFDPSEGETLPVNTFTMIKRSILFYLHIGLYAKYSFFETILAKGIMLHRHLFFRQFEGVLNINVSFLYFHFVFQYQYLHSKWGLQFKCPSNQIMLHTYLACVSKHAHQMHVATLHVLNNFSKNVLYVTWCKCTMLILLHCFAAINRCFEVIS